MPLIAVAVLLSAPASSSAAALENMANAAIGGVVQLDGCGRYPSPTVHGLEDDAFFFSLADPARVIFRVSDDQGSCAPSFLTLYNAAGTQIITWNGTLPPACSKLQVYLPAGDYQLRLDNFVKVPYVLEYFRDDCSTCGNGVLEAEDCDDGNKDAGDGCDSVCGLELPVLVPCEPSESPGFGPTGYDVFAFSMTASGTVRLRIVAEGGCTDSGIDIRDANGISGSGGFGVGCIEIETFLFAGDYTAWITGSAQDGLGAYDLEFSTEQCATCGNGIRDVGEECDGNDVDDCTVNVCTQACTCPVLPGVCGDSIVQVNEDCDDGNNLAGDGCDGSCHVEVPDLVGCGTYPVANFGQTFSLELTETVLVRLAVDQNGGCNDSWISIWDGAGDQIDFAAAGAGACAQLLAPLTAGAYRIEAYEFEAGEGLRLSYYDDRCSMCGNGIVEAEECDSGSASGGELCDAECRAKLPVLEACGRNPNPGFGAYDVLEFSFEIDTPQAVRLTIDEEHVGCPDSVWMSLYGPDHGVVWRIYGGFGDCSIVQSLPAGRYVVRLAGDGFFGRDIGPYSLDYFTSSCSTCGNGILEAEQCDDGNTLDNDGCSATCEKQFPELQPCGEIESPGLEGFFDEDVYTFTLIDSQAVRVELTDAEGGCPTDARLVLYGLDDEPIDLEFVSHFCPPIFATLPAGKYSVHIYGSTVFQPYILRYSTGACSVCGNGKLEAEECDDGNLEAGDGCGGDCREELPNLDTCGGYDSSVYGSGLSDEYRFSLSSPSTVRIETVDDAGACTGNTVLTLFDAGGRIIAEDDNGIGDILGPPPPGACTRIVLPLASGEYRLKLEQESFPIAHYVLEYYNSACSTCGNCTDEAEECDDCNGVDTDGCDSSCRLRLASCTSAILAPGFPIGGANEFRLVLDRDEVVHLETTGAGGGCPGDTILKVFDLAGNLVAIDDQSGEGPCSSLTTEMDAGEYRVVIAGFGGESIVSYSLVFNDGSCSTCGNDQVELGEACDDDSAPDVSGAWCRSSCKQTAHCGQPISIAAEDPVSSDALFALRSAVGAVSCDLRVCDVNETSTITVLDALVILRAATGLPATLSCPL